jgi:uncharacterized iron-regulated membrane protein
MKQLVAVRRLHKWFALIAGVQILIWSLSGLYMTVVDLDIIHGDHLVTKSQTVKLNDLSVVPISPSILNQFTPIKSIELKSYFGAPVYEIQSLNKQLHIVDAHTGTLKSALDKQQISNIAASIYAGDAKVRKVEKLPNYPSEIGARDQDVWLVQYDDLVNSSLYFHPLTGKLLSKRTDLWRTFDFLWILHIMEYAKSDGYEGYLFRIFSTSSFLLAIFGAWLLIYRLRAEVSK